MTRHRAARSVLVLGSVLASAAPPTVGLGQTTTAPAPSTPTLSAPAASAPTVVVSKSTGPEVTILQALQSNPLTAPYRFAVTGLGRQYSLAGTVGSKVAHDAAIRTVIALGYPVRDDLTIDTAAGYGTAGPTAGGAGVYGAPYLGVGGTPYIYPPPLFGRLDDPFYGFEPPLVSYPPWWGAVAAREPLNPTVLAQVDPSGLIIPAEAGVALPPDSIEMNLDARGVAVLRGRVPTLADRVAIGQKIAATRGITQVVNLLEVGGQAPQGVNGQALTMAPGQPSRPVSDTPPPPPTPAILPVPRGQAAPRGAEHPAVVAEADPLARRVAEAVARRPLLAAAPPKVSASDGVVTLSGHVPSSYEAMLAFRAAQQTPGVRDVVDRMEFPLPDVDGPNPLRDKGRPEDIEPYLLAQVRRQVGDLAHVDQVHLRGDVLEIRGTITRVDDTPRVEATLRSVPLLRGFKLDPVFVAE